MTRDEKLAVGAEAATWVGNACAATVVVLLGAIAWRGNLDGWPPPWATAKIAALAAACGAAWRLVCLRAHDPPPPPRRDGRVHMAHLVTMVAMRLRRLREAGGHPAFGPLRERGSTDMMAVTTAWFRWPANDAADLGALAEAMALKIHESLVDRDAAGFWRLAPPEGVADYSLVTDPGGTIQLLIQPCRFDGAQAPAETATHLRIDFSPRRDWSRL